MYMYMPFWLKIEVAESEWIMRSFYSIISVAFCSRIFKEYALIKPLPVNLTAPFKACPIID